MKLTRAAIKPWVLPFAMLLGMVLHNYIGEVAFLSRYLIFFMLLVTYCRVSVRELRPARWTWRLLLLQYAAAIALYFILNPLNPILAQAAFLCVYCPTATAAPVVTGLLGGSVARVATYSLSSHIIVAVSAPFLLSMMNPDAGISFADSVGRIAVNVLPVILGPLLLALLMQAFTPRLHRTVANHQGLSFYVWAIALIIVIGNSVSFVMQEPPERIPEELAIGLVSLVLCVGQFTVGRRVGQRYGEPISAAQSVGQKNTILAIWLALTFLNPIISIAPATYIVWHNSYNSWQIFRKLRKE